VGCNGALLERARRAVPVHLLRRPPLRAESGIGAILSASSGPATTVITRFVARRAQDAQTNTPPTTPTHLFMCVNPELRCQWEGQSEPDEKLTEGSRALDDGETDRLNVKLEEDTRNALMTNLSFIVCHAVLVRM